MSTGGFEVPTPILNGPFDEPALHWHLEEGVSPEQQPGRRPAGYYYRDPRKGVQDGGGSRGIWREMPLVNLIRDRVREWRAADRYLIVEIKGADWEGTAEIKAQAAHRWCAAVNATRRFGHWDYVLVNRIPDLVPVLDKLVATAGAAASD